MMTIEEFLVPIDSRADAERVDIMEALLRGELSKEDFETVYKNQMIDEYEKK
jgi:Trp operon repressor